MLAPLSGEQTGKAQQSEEQRWESPLTEGLAELDTKDHQVLECGQRLWCGQESLGRTQDYCDDKNKSQRGILDPRPDPG